MTNYDHVSSVELSKKLKAIGVASSSSHSWFLIVGEWRLDNEFAMGATEYVLAYSVAELGDILNDRLGATRTHYWYTFKGVKWFGHWSGSGEVVEGDTEAEARARLLIYLIENGTIKTSTSPAQSS